MVVSLQIIFVHWFYFGFFFFFFLRFSLIFPLLIYLLYYVHFCQQSQVLFGTKSMYLSPNMYLPILTNLRCLFYWVSSKTINVPLFEFQYLVVYGFKLLRPLTALQREPWTAFIGQDIEAR